jgi:hypothetical protein
LLQFVALSQRAIAFALGLLTGNAQPFELSTTDRLFTRVSLHGALARLRQLGLNAAAGVA